jgi:hypothetical protein
VNISCFWYAFSLVDSVNVVENEKDYVVIEVMYGLMIADFVVSEVEMDGGEGEGPKQSADVDDCGMSNGERTYGVIHEVWLEKVKN